MTTRARVRRSQPTRVPANGVELCVQTFGETVDPTILLVAGAASSMDWWEDDFCERLAFGSRFVIRYDLRDTGQSVSYEPGAPQYGGQDLVADAVGILDVLRVGRAHVVGISMGGGIGEHLALDHADRVASLTLISTSPGGPGLPPMSDELRASVRAAGCRAGLVRPASRGRLHHRGPARVRRIGHVRRGGDAGARRQDRRPHGQHRVGHDEPLDPRGRRTVAAQVLRA